MREFTNNLNEEVKVYLNDLVIIVLGYIESPHYSRDVKYWALYSLGSIVGAAEKKIAPYVNNILKALLDITNNQQMSAADIGLVKGQAVMCAG